MKKILIDPSERTQMFQVIAGNTQMCGQQVQAKLEQFEKENTEENQHQLEFAQEQLKDHQSIYACVQTVLTMLNPTSLETTAKTIEQHINRLQEEIDVCKDLEFLKKLEYNIIAWKKVQKLMSILAVNNEENFMEEWKAISK